MPKLVYPAVSVRGLSRLTGLHRDYITARIVEAQPTGKRNGYPVYSLEHVLPLLCRPAAAVDGQPIDPDSLAPVDRRAWFDSELRRRQLQVRDRELIPAVEVEETVGTAFSRCAQAIFAVPDNLERRAGLSPEQAQICETAIDAAMNDLADNLSGMTDTKKGKDDE